MSMEQFKLSGVSGGAPINVNVNLRIKDECSTPMNSSAVSNDFLNGYDMYKRSNTINKEMEKLFKNTPINLIRETTEGDFTGSNEEITKRLDRIIKLLEIIVITSPTVPDYVKVDMCIDNVDNIIKSLDPTKG